MTHDNNYKEDNKNSILILKSKNRMCIVRQLVTKLI